MYSGSSSISAINSLPNELLSKIFLNAATKFLGGAFVDFATTPRSDLFIIANLRLVCKRWNEVTRSTKKLWASAINVDSNRLNRDQWFAQLAGGVPLVISSTNGSSYQDFGTPTWHDAIQHINSWGSFFLQLSVFSDKRQLTAAISRPAPLLRSFEMHLKWIDMGNVYYFEDEEMDNRIPSPFVLPPCLFAGDAPQLRRLLIANVYFPPAFDFSVFKQLTVLCVQQDLDEYADGDLYSRRWLEILGEMPHLQHLLLRWDGSYSNIRLPNFPTKFPSNSRGGDVLRTNPLNSLRNLDFLSTCRIGDYISSSIFAKVDIPAVCTAHIVVSYNDEEVFPLDKLKVGLDHCVKQWRAAGAHLKTDKWDVVESDVMEFGCQVIVSIPNVTSPAGFLLLYMDFPSNAIPIGKQRYDLIFSLLPVDDDQAV